MNESICKCKTDQWQPLFSVPDFDTGTYQRSLRCCIECGVAQIHPVPNSATIDRVYDADYYTSTGAKFNAAIEAWTRRAGRSRARKLLARSGGKEQALDILDFGCGRGVLLEGFKARGHNVLGIERSGSGFDSLPDISTQSLQELVDAGRQFDVIVLWHVLEHLDDPEDTISSLQRLLRDDGKMYIEVPNFGSLQAKLFKSHWFHLDIPRHLTHFSEESLTKLLARNGLKISQLKTFSFDQNLYGFVQSAFNALPILPENHLYRVLKSGLSIRSLIGLLLYSPFIAILSLPAALELVLSQISGNGAVLSLELVNND